MRFYFDFISPYAYLGWVRARALCNDRQLPLEATPILFAGVLGHWGQLGPAEITPKRRFTFRDSFRRAHELGLVLTPPATHPFNPLTALRVSTPEVAGDAQHDVIDALYRATWSDGLEMSDPAVIAKALTDAGFDGAAMVAKTKDPAVKERLKTNTADAIEAGVFGVPTFVVNGELFFGQDRLKDVERFLDGNDPAAELDESRLERSASAHRPR